MKFCDRLPPSTKPLFTLCGSPALFVNFSSSSPSLPIGKGGDADKVYILYASHAIPLLCPLAALPSSPRGGSVFLLTSASQSPKVIHEKVPRAPPAARPPSPMLYGANFPGGSCVKVSFRKPDAPSGIWTLDWPSLKDEMPNRRVNCTAECFSFVRSAPCIFLCLFRSAFASMLFPARCEGKLSSS